MIIETSRDYVAFLTSFHTNKWAFHDIITFVKTDFIWNKINGDFWLTYLPLYYIKSLGGLMVSILTKRWGRGSKSGW